MSFSGDAPCRWINPLPEGIYHKRKMLTPRIVYLDVRVYGSKK